jgi:NAD(P)-dependent dehydrogenase (short-subunit alcohol dehydrogenase family)
MARVFVTGSSSGLGLDTATALQVRGHDVVVHARTRARVPAGQWAGAVTGDLSDPSQVLQVAQGADDLGRFDAVIHNAGTTEPSVAVAVNTLAPYVLTAVMRRPTRLIYLSSSMHRTGSTDLSALASASGSYSDSKLWVTVLSAAVARLWRGTASHAVDPGWVPTRMGGAGAPDDLAAGHETQVWLATDADIEPATGGYWHHRRTQEPHRAVHSERLQAELLGVLQEATGCPFA